MNEPPNLDDFRELSSLVKGYELDPNKIYLIVCDGKDFSTGAAHSLFKNLREMHPNINIAVVGTTKPKSVKVMEKNDGPAADVISGQADQEIEG